MLDLDPADPTGEGTGRELLWPLFCDVGVGVVQAFTSLFSSPVCPLIVLGPSYKNENITKYLEIIHNSSYIILMPIKYFEEFIFYKSTVFPS